MAASRKRTARPKRPFSWLRVYHIFLGILKGFVVFTVSSVIIDGLLSSTAGTAMRFNALFVLALACISLAYLHFVSSRVWVDIPGIDETDLARDDESTPSGIRGVWGRMARKLKEKTGRDVTPGTEVTIQVSRLSSTASRVNIVNDAPLPVLRAEASFDLASEFGGETASAGQEARRVTGESFSIPAHGVEQGTLGNAFNHVGIYRLRTASVRVHDLLGLLSRERGTARDRRVRVVPNIYRLPNGIPWDRKMTQSDLGVPEAPSDALDYDRVRDYQPGDPLKTIHWKLVAHSQGELYTKLFETSTVSTVTLVVDPYGLDATTLTADKAYHLYDAMLEGGFSLIEHAREIGFDGSLRYADRHGTLVETAWAGPAVLGPFVETAMRPSSTGAARAQSISTIDSLRDAQRSYVIFATSGLTDGSVEALIACHQAGVPLLVVHALPSSQHEIEQRAYDARLRTASIAVVGITDGPQIVREVMSS